MEQVKAINALEPFLALTKSATSPRAAADLVTRATSAPGTYVFAELLQAPQIQALAQSPDHAPYHTLLDIFSHGTYSTYTSTPDLPPLNEQQTLKLRQLSLLSLAKDPHNLTYANLQSSLGLPDARAVENLVISAVYADLITAQLDPRNQCVLVSSMSPLRDLAPNSIPSMLESLQAWSERCTGTLADLEAQIQAIKDTAASRASDKKAWAEKTDGLIAAELNDAAARDRGGAGGVHSRNQTNLLSRAVDRMRSTGGRFGKRDRPASLGLDMDSAEDDVMDVDDNEDDGFAGDSGLEGSAGAAGKKRASRRKL